MTHPTCECRAAQLVQLSLRGEDLPPCSVHRPATSDATPAIALNDDHALAAQLGMTLNKENF